MKLSNWIRFTWNLTQLPAFTDSLPEHYEIAPASADDEKELRKIISTSFVLDPAWSPEMNEVTERLEAGIPPLKEIEPQIQEAMYMQAMQPALRTYDADST